MSEATPRNTLSDEARNTPPAEEIDLDEIAELKAFLLKSDLPGPRKKKLLHYLDLIVKIAVTMSGTRAKFNKLLRRMFGRKTEQAARAGDAGKPTKDEEKRVLSARVRDGGGRGLLR